MTNHEIITRVLLEGSNQDIIEVLSFDIDSTVEQIAIRFQYFSRRFFPGIFKNKTAPFHFDFIKDYARSYVGEDNVLELGFRGCGKTGLFKVFVVFVLLCDKAKRRMYTKVLSRDGKNPRQFITDVYNGCIQVRDVFGDVFLKEDDKKRETTMGSFTMKDGRKLIGTTVGQTQRGHVQDIEAYRPDWIIGDDVEDRESISSAIITQGIINSIDEAITGMPVDGSGNWCFLGNYISDTGVIEHMKERASLIRITPILDASGKKTWEEIPDDVIEGHKKSIDFFGEYMCDPKRSIDKFFDVERIERDMQNATPPKYESAGVKYWDTYQPHHRYALGSDHSEGIGQDSNTMALFDFDTGVLVATHASNTIAPNLHAHECARVGREFGTCLWAPEINNMCGGIVISTAKELGYTNLYKPTADTKLYSVPTDMVGWKTTGNTKTTAFMDFRTAYNDGEVHIFDLNVLKEMKAYSNNDLVDRPTGLITRHFDLLMAVVIAWRVRNNTGITNMQPTQRNEKELVSSLVADAGL